MRPYPRRRLWWRKVGLSRKGGGLEERERQKIVLVL